MSINKRKATKNSNRRKYVVVTEMYATMVAGGVGGWGVFELAGAGCKQAGVGRRGVLAGGECWQTGLLAGGARRCASGMVIITSIDREAAHDDGREFTNFSVNLLHCDFLPLFNQYCLHLSNCGNSLRGSAPLNSPLQ